MAGLTSLAQALLNKNNPARSEVALIDLDPSRGDAPIDSRRLLFQYFPEQIDDSKEINYQRIDVPGGSLPIYQWMNSGERSIGFTAHFSSDLDYLVNGDVSELAQIVAAEGLTARNVSIPAAQLWLNRFMYPRYGDGASVTGELTQAPRRLLLVIPGSSVGLAGGGSATARDSVACVMTACSWSILKYFPSGMPRYATCQLTFAQIAQRGGVVTFPSSREMDTEVTTGSVRMVGYKMKSLNKTVLGAE